MFENFIFHRGNSRLLEYRNLSFFLVLKEEILAL